MAKNTVNEATQSLTTSVREANQAIVKSATAVQERNMQFAQSTLENGIEVLKSYAEDSRHLTHELAEQPQQLQEAFQTVVNTALAAQERNVKYAQSILQNGSDVLKAHAEGTRDLVQTLVEQSRKQQEYRVTRTTLFTPTSEKASTLRAGSCMRVGNVSKSQKVQFIARKRRKK